MYEVDEGFVAHAKLMKDKQVAAMDPEVKQSDDIAPVLMLKDDEGPCALVFVHQIDRDAALDAAWILAPTFGATEVLAAFDSHFAQGEHAAKNPATGKPWGPGEMQHACDAEGACTLGVITDTIAVMGFRKDRSHWSVNLPYHVGYSTKEVHWQERTDHLFEPGETALTGLIPDVMYQSLDRQSFRDAIDEEATKVFGRPMTDIAEAMELTPRQAKLHGWLAILPKVQDDRWTVALCLQSEEEMEVAKRSMGASA
jgi:hypothetical protein